MERRLDEILGVHRAEVICPRSVLFRLWHVQACIICWRAGRCSAWLCAQWHRNSPFSRIEIDLGKRMAW